MFDGGEDETRARIQYIWEALADGGQVRMELSEYPHSKLYGWVEDHCTVERPCRGWAMLRSATMRCRAIPSSAFPHNNSTENPRDSTRRNTEIFARTFSPGPGRPLSLE